MKLSEAEIRNWVKIISDEYMHFDEAGIERAVSLGKLLEVDLLPEGAGGIGYHIYEDFDCKKRMGVVIFYCKPEQRGKYLVYMLHRIEEIAKQERVHKITIGSSISGYKEEKFGRMLKYFGFKDNGFIKEI